MKALLKHPPVLRLCCSNVGANFSLIGSLAAVMWVKLLKVRLADSKTDVCIAAPMAHSASPCLKRMH